MKTYSIFLASSFELQPERVKFGNFINSENKRLQAKNVFLRLEVWEDMDDAFNTTCKQEDYNEYLAKCKICVVLFWNKVGKYTLQEYELARKLSLENELRLYVYEKNAKPNAEPKPSEKESKERFLHLLQKNGKEQFQGQFENYSELENRFRKTLDGLFDSGILIYGERAKMLSPNGPIVPNPFLGREKELKILEDKFEKSPQTLLIHAEGGMGKTTLASKYWYESGYRYSHQAWLFCDQGIMDALKTLAPKLGLDPMAFNQLKEEEQIQTLKVAISNLEGDFLLVLDNANHAEHIKEFLRQFRGFRWNVLITSSCREIIDSKENELLLEHLSPEEAKALFLEYYRENNEDFDPLLYRFLEGLNYHTLLIEVFAKNLKEASELGMDLKGFLGELEAKGLILDEDNNFEIKSSWTGNVDKKANFTNDILEILYDFSKLTEEERLFLVNISLIPSNNFTLEFLLELFEPENKRAFRDSLKNLFRKGWIGGTKDDKPIYRLSPVIQSLIQTKFKETLWKDGQAIFIRLKELLKYEQEKDNHYQEFKWIPFGNYFADRLKVEDNVEFFWYLNDLSLIKRDSGGKNNLESARKYLEKSRDFFSLKGSNSLNLAKTQANLASVLKYLGGRPNLEEAKNLMESALSFGELEAKEISRFRTHLAMILRDLGKENLPRAKEILESELISKINPIQDKKERARISYNIATVLIELGGEDDLLKAKNLLEAAILENEQNFGSDSVKTAGAKLKLAVVLRKIGGKENLVKARNNLEDAIVIEEKNDKKNRTSIIRIYEELATVLEIIGGEDSIQKAITYLESAYLIGCENFGEDSQCALILKTRILNIEAGFRFDSQI